VIVSIHTKTTLALTRYDLQYIWLTNDRTSHECLTSTHKSDS